MSTNESTDREEYKSKLIDMMEGELNEANAAEFELLMARYLKNGGSAEELVYSFLGVGLAGLPGFGASSVADGEES